MCLFHALDRRRGYHLLGTRGGGTGRLVFRDVRVPEANLAGDLGGVRAALEVAVRYSNRRQAFGQTIRRFQGVSFKVPAVRHRHRLGSRQPGDADRGGNRLFQHEFYREVLGDPRPGRLIEADAAEANAADEKVYEDEEMWVKGW